MGVIPFQIPNKVVMNKATDFHGVFEFSPLEKGYGVTIGNAMRRILLSSTPPGRRNRSSRRS